MSGAQSTPPPIPCVWRDGAFHPLQNFRRVAEQHYGEGEVVPLAPHEQRSWASHGHYFAVLNNCWLSLSDEQTERFRTAEALRKYCLIKAGYRDERSIVCSSKAEARRLAAFIGPMDDFAIVTVSEAVVTAYTAKSQSVKAMGKQTFAESKEAVFGVLAELLGVEPTSLARAA